MSIVLFKIALLLTFAVFVIPKRLQYHFGLVVQLIVLSTSSMWAIQSLFSNIQTTIQLLPFMGNMLHLHIDALSAFFILVINFTTLTGYIYALGYLQPYFEKKNKTEFALHYFNLLWLNISMLLVVMIHDSLAFLVIWEIMSLSSFFLVIFESDKKDTIAIGIKYLIQMHVGVVFLMAAFLIPWVQSGAEFSFSGLSTYFASHNPYWVFMLFFVGFGIKAGFIPFHSWLPHAHPAAPSHVSGIMSGVMIKMGIYGILRVLTYIHHDLFDIGLTILIVSLFSGLTGVSLAIVQHDVKKLLAYHSIENIGIIGIGIGIGVIGLSENIPLLAALGFAGGIFHILNHSLFKSLLFYTAGAVYQQTHTRNIEHLGGLIRKMPKTALFFLLGALAISGLPPFNGFISEFLIYSGMFKSLHSGILSTDIILLFSFISLAIIGGLAVFCFTKVTSIIFLGTPRSNKTAHAKEVSKSMIIPDIMIAIMIILIGLAPVIFIEPISNIVVGFTGNASEIQHIIPTLNNISIASGIFILLIITMWLLRSWQQNKHKINNAPTWGCGYTGANPAIHQYTATSYADNYVQLSSKLVNVKKKYTPFGEDEIFPQERDFKTHSSDIFEDNLISAPSDKLLKILKRAAIFQTGKIQHYLLYALAFLTAIFLLTYFNII